MVGTFVYKIPEGTRRTRTRTGGRMNNQSIHHKQNTQKDKPLYCSFCNSYLNHKLQTEERRTQSSINTMHMSNHANKFLLLLSIGASAIFSISASFALVPVLT